jgi:adenylate cyclase
MGKDIELAILFADVVGSTQLYEVLGDTRARETVASCIEIMQLATEQNNGTVIKTMGDEIMATFPDGDAALNAAAQMQKLIGDAKDLDIEGGAHVAIRIGCHFGPVVLENRDIFGSAVHTANRMTSQAKASQIIITEEVVRRLSPEWVQAVRQIDVAPIRGKSDELGLYEVLWQTEDVTSMVPTLNVTEGRADTPGTLRVVCQGKEVILDESKSSLTMGRSDDNDIVVKGNLISRIHARIEQDRNKYLLIDQSTNGTFVHQSEGEDLFVRRDSMQLTGDGILGLGRATEHDSPLAIHFSTKK